MKEFFQLFNPFYETKPAVEPFDYNPSHWSQRVPICCLAVVGFLIAVYMGLYQWKLIDTAWDPIFGNDSTEQVLDSNVSARMEVWFCVPDAVFGAVAYLGDAIFGLVGSTRRWQFRPWMVILFGIDVIPLGIVSAVLVVLQGMVVGYWCTLCLVTAVISLILVRMAYDEVWTCLKFLYRVKQRSRSWRVLWGAFWGKDSDIATEIGREMVREV